MIDQLRMVRRGGYEMAALDGKFSALETREFPAGSFYLDMAQPMANAAFYYLEPQARDGFVGWRRDGRAAARGAGEGRAGGVSDLQDATGDQVARGTASPGPPRGVARDLRGGVAAHRGRRRIARFRAGPKR